MASYIRPKTLAIFMRTFKIEVQQCIRFWKYVPKQANFDDYTDKKIAMIQKKINSRPRQKLNFETPQKEFCKRIL